MLAIALRQTLIYRKKNRIASKLTLTKSAFAVRQRGLEIQKDAKSAHKKPDHQDRVFLFQDATDAVRSLSERRGWCR